MAHAVVAQYDRYALVNNIAGIASLREASLFSSYHSHYGFDGINTLAFGVVVPWREDLAGGISIQRFGDKVYNELSLGAGLAHRINRVSLGLRVNYRQLAVTTSTLSISRKALVVEMGGIVQLTSTLYFGAHIYNLTQSGFSGDRDTDLPTLLRTGLTYKPTAGLRVSAELYKNTDYPASIRAGLEYELIKRLLVRTGLSTKPYTNHFGLGLAGDSFSLDYAATSHPQLGWSHHVTLSYGWKKPEKPKSEQ